MNYANRYFEAATITNSNSGNVKGFDPIPYQLYCQSLELHLKSFIWLKEQVGRDAIKNRYGHDIEKLWNDAKRKGINKYIKITPLRDQVINLVGPYYKDRRFCYLDIDMIYDGFKNLKSEPKSISTLFRLTLQLGKSLRAPIYKASQPK